MSVLKTIFYNNVDSIEVAWLDWKPRKYNTFEPVYRLQQDIPDLTAEFLRTSPMPGPEFNGPKAENRQRPRMNFLDEMILTKVEKVEAKLETVKREKEAKKETSLKKVENVKKNKSESKNTKMLTRRMKKLEI